jgi:hypothetical protein
MSIIDDNEKPLIEKLILHMKCFVSDDKERFSNFELEQDTESYILSAEVQGNQIAAHELTSMFADKNVSVLFSNSKLYVRAILQRDNSQSTPLKVRTPFHYTFN